MASNWNYTVTHYDGTDSWAATDITEDVIAIPTFTSAGSGEMNSAKLVLAADRGKYIKVIGSSPRIRQFDRIRIVVTDGLTAFSYNRVFDVIKMTPIKTKSQGTRLQLVLLGIEHWLDKVNYAKTSYYDTAFNVLKDIGQSYNAHRGNLMPELKGHDDIAFNGLPDYTSNIYDYGLNEDTCYVRMNDVIDKLGASADDGGVLDFFELSFISSVSSVEEITVRARRSGSNPLSPVTIEDSTNVNVGESEGGIEAITGTVINAWGANDQGSIPRNFSRFKSRQQRFPSLGKSLFPEYQAGITYQAGSIVQKLGVVFTTAADTGLPPPLAPWTILTPSIYYGNTITYSEFTDEAVDVWRNSGVHPVGTLGVFQGKGFWDANICIRDNPKNESKPVFSTWADLQHNSDSYSTLWKYNDDPTGIYRGTRLLVIGTGGGALTGTDKNGKTFANSIVEFDGKDWIVKYEPKHNLYCAIMAEAKLYQFQSSDTWIDVTATPNGSHCFHYYDSLGSAESAILNRDTGLEFPSANNGSAVKVVYTWNPSKTFMDQALGGGTDKNYYSAGAWLNLRFPLPPNHYSPEHQLGELYGGALQVAGVPDSNMEPATLDIQNMHLSHDGFRGFNKGESSEDLGQISSIDFMMKLLYIVDAGLFTLDPYQANFKMRCYVIDIDDNVASQDFVIYFNDEWQAVSLPISGFQTYRGRKPRNLKFLVDNIIFPKGLDAQEIFEWRHVKQICFQTQDSYDELGRYSPASGRYAGIDQFTTIIPGLRLKLEMSIDAFRFTKPLLVNTGAVTDRQIEPNFLQKQEIGNYEQLKSDAFAELEKSKFQRVLYDVTTTGRFDVGIFDSFFLKDSEIVPDFSPAQPGEAPGIIRLVAKKVDYSITKPVEGKGGFLRTLTGVRRFL